MTAEALPGLPFWIYNSSDSPSTSMRRDKRPPLRLQRQNHWVKLMASQALKPERPGFEPQLCAQFSGDHGQITLTLWVSFLSYKMSLGKESSLQSWWEDQKGYVHILPASVPRIQMVVGNRSPANLAKAKQSDQVNNSLLNINCETDRFHIMWPPLILTLMLWGHLSFWVFPADKKEGGSHMIKGAA